MAVERPASRRPTWLWWVWTRRGRPVQQACSVPVDPRTSCMPIGRASISATVSQAAGHARHVSERWQRWSPVGPLHAIRRQQSETSISAVIGTGLGGGVIIEGNVVKGRKGFGGELGHVLIPYQSISGIDGTEAGMQLRPHGRSRIGMLSDRHREVRSCRSFCRAIPATRWPPRIFTGRQAGARNGREGRRDVPRDLPRSGARARPVLR